jgi:putative membrane protein
MFDFIPPKAGRPFLRVTAALVFAVLAQHLSAQTAPVNPAAAEIAKPLSTADKKFIKDASESMYAEMAIVDIALRRNRPVGATGDVAKKLGDKLHPDLKKVWEELSAFAQLKNEKMRSELSGIEKREIEQLRLVDIEKFNKQVVALLEKETKKLALIFESKSVQHPALATIVESHAPTFKQHAVDVASQGK